MKTSAVSFQRRFRYRLGRRLSKVPPPLTHVVPLSFDIHLMVTASVEYLFHSPSTVAPDLLEPDGTFYLPYEDIGIFPATSYPVRLIDKQETIEATAIFHELPTVSGNLFQPLGKHQVGGKNYRQPSPAQLTLFSDFGVENHKTNKIDGYRKSFTETRADRNHLSRKGVDLWDLLLPLLQPPIDHAFVDILDLPPRCAPYPYQWEGIKFLVERSAALLGDDMGTGKTVQSILACRLLFQRGLVQKCLVVCPLSVLAQWDKELEKWAPCLRTTVVRGSVEHRQVCWTMPAHVWLTTYETLRQDMDFLLGNRYSSFELAIVDETQRIKTRSAGISQAVRQLATKYRWALTGTPIENRIAELASIFAFLSPGLFPTHEVLPEYAKKLIEPFFLRRRKEDVLKDLPAKEEFPIWLRLGERQQETYEQMERERVVELHKQGTAISAQSIVTLIGELKKICNRDPVSGDSAKLEWLVENIPDVLEAGDKVLIFTQYRQQQFGGTEWLEKELQEYGPLNYGHADTDNKRESLLHAFETNPANRVFLGHPRTAGLGLNQLVAANYVVHFDHWWNPAVTNQATARAHRPNQTKKVFVYHLWVEDTIEELVLQKTLAKQRLYDEVIDSLSSGISEELLFEIYDDLLVKHGFKPLHLGDRPKANRSGKDLEFALESVGSPRDFELLVGRLFQAMGFSTRVTQYSKDGGIDVIASREVGLSVEKNAVQCKFQRTPIGRPALQQLLGVVASDSTFTRGILVTNADASRDAVELARQNGRLQIITGHELEGLLKKYRIE
ncbi:MAG: restriction endonuclease [Lentisphaerae bacterium]|nr:restriction endonuclease [Lentisphaerota bacterium]